MSSSSLELRPESARDKCTRLRRRAQYRSLRKILEAALAHAAEGKGRERHERGSGVAFEQQPMLAIARELGAAAGPAAGFGFLIGQAKKKAGESLGRDGFGRRSELLGAINYLAAAILYGEEVDSRPQATVVDCPR